MFGLASRRLQKHNLFILEPLWISTLKMQRKILKRVKFNEEPLSPCHHGMARPQVADGGNGLQI
jgi:hypothetical protein